MASSPRNRDPWPRSCRIANRWSWVPDSRGACPGRGSGAVSGTTALVRGRTVSTQRICLDLADLRLQRNEQRLDPAARNAPRDEHEPAAAVRRGPAVEPGGSMKDVLNAVQDCWPVRALRNSYDAFQAQQIGAAMLGERFQKQHQRHRTHRLLAHERIGRDLGVMPVV